MSIIDDVMSAAGSFIGTPVKLDTGKHAKIVGSIVSIGPDKVGAGVFFFNEFEVPTELPFGRYQMSAVHNFHGGGRAIDLFGDQPHPIELHGELFNLTYSPDVVHTNGLYRERHEKGETAMQRMQKMQMMCVEGARMLFQFHQFKFHVVVLDASFVAYNWNDVKYTLKLEVIDDNLDQGVVVSPLKAAALNPPAQKALLQQFVALAKSATKVLSIANLAIATIDSVVTTAKRDPASLLLAGVPLLPGGLAATQLIRQALLTKDALVHLKDDVWPQFALDMTNAQPFDTLHNEAYKKYLKPGAALTKQQMDTVNNFFLNDYAKLRSTPKGPALSPELVSYLATHGTRTSATLGQINHTIDKILKPVRSYTLSVKDPNLSKVALQVYNDATKWTVLADANGLTKMINTGVYNLVIPYADQIDGGVNTLTPSATSGT